MRRGLTVRRHSHSIVRPSLNIVAFTPAEIELVEPIHSDDSHLDRATSDQSHAERERHSGASRRAWLTASAAAAGGLLANVAGSASSGFRPREAQGADQPSSGRRPPLADPRGGFDSMKKMLAGKEPVTWLITGDSITHGALHTLGWRSYPEHFAERVRWELRRVRDVVINTGISGDRTGGLLNDWNWRVARFQPDVVSVMLGMNDCTAGEAGRETFRTNLKAIVARTLEIGAVPLLHTPNTTYVKNSGGRGDLPAYAAIVREVAQAEQVALVDHWAHWQKAKPDQEALLPWIEDKSIHPGVYGHREFAKLMFKELGIFDANSPTCKLEVP